MASKATQDTRRAREEVRANIERIGTLLKEGNTESAKELTEETEALLPQLSTTGRREMTKALKDVQTTPAEIELSSTVDYRTALQSAGADPGAVVDDAAASLRETMDAVGRAVQKYMAFAELMFAQYSKFQHNGAPDIMANSQAARDFASDMKASVREQLVATGAEEEDAQRQVESAWRDYKKRMSDYRARYAAELDVERFKELYPTVAQEHPDASPAEALSMHYNLDLLGYSERQRRHAKIANLRSKLDGASKAEREVLEEQIAEIQASMGSSPGKSKAIDPVKSTRRTLKSIGATVTELDPETVRRLPARERRVIAQTVPTHLARLNEVLLAAQDTDEE